MYAFFLATLLCMLGGCSRSDIPGSKLVIAEGEGMEGVCDLGDSSFPRSPKLGVVRQRVVAVEDTFRETEISYPECGLIVDMLDAGEGSKVVRVSALADKPTKNNQPLSFVTKQGLEIVPRRASRTAVIDMYGRPLRVVDSLADIAVVEAIRDGVPYSIVKSTSNIEKEYIHYPGVGIAFFLEQGLVVKCSVEKPKVRRIWRY